MDLAKAAEVDAAHADAGAAAGMERRIVLLGGIAGLGDIHAAQEGLDLALPLEEVLVLTVGAEHQMLRLVRQDLAGLRQVDLRQLIELDGNASLLEITLPAEYRLEGTPLAALSLPPTCNIACITRAGRTIIPRGQTVLYGGDVMLVVAQRGAEKDLRRALKIKD